MLDLGGGVFLFEDGTHALEIGFHRRNWAPLDLGEVAEVTYVGPAIVRLDVLLNDSSDDFLG